MTTDNDNGPAVILIDPPVGPYSTCDEIRAWIRELEAMPRIPYVPEALEEARDWLKLAEDQDLNSQ